jgi:hypothetical protein
MVLPSFSTSSFSGGAGSLPSTMLRRRAPRSAGRTRAFQRRWFPRVSFSAGGFPMVGGAVDEEAIGISLGDIVETTGTGFWVFVEIDLDWYWFFFLSMSWKRWL